MTIRFRMSSIMCVIRPEQLELFALEFKKKSYISLCLHCSIYKYQPFNSRLGQNIYDSKTSDEFNFGYNQARTTAKAQIERCLRSQGLKLIYLLQLVSGHRSDHKFCTI